jgi:uncharacterized protein
VTRGGRVKAQDEPERRCIVTRETGPKAGLVRFVLGPDQAVVPDLAERLPGRGLWVTADGTTLRTAAAKGHFARAAKAPAKVPPDLVERVEALLATRLIERLAMARKAGQALAGFEKVKAALMSGDAALLMQATDGSPRERAELRPPMGENSQLDCLSAAELGMAFGRDRVIHAAVLAGGLADRVRYEGLRLQGVRRGVDRQPFGNGTADELAGEGSRGKG